MKEFKKLEELHLENNKIGDNVRVEILRSMKTSSTPKIYESSSKILLSKQFIEWVYGFIQAFRNDKSIAEIDLSGAGIEKAIVLDISEMLKVNTHLTKINLSNTIV